MELLERRDSIIDIQDHLTPFGIRINIPSFLDSGKRQFEEHQMIETRRIASLRIHMEREMKRVKEFHIFDTPISASLIHACDQIFTVCAILTNFMPPLC